MGFSRPYCRKPCIKLTAAVVCALIFIAAVSALVLQNNVEDVTKKNGKLTVDVTNASEGYFTASCPATDKKMKMRVTFGEEVLTYSLNSEGEAETFPLQFGDGKYTVVLYENVSGKKYSQAGKVTFSVTLEDPMAPFLHPNQYVNYTDETEAVSIAREVCGPVANTSTGLRWLSGSETDTAQATREQTDQEKFEAIRSFIKKNFTYDYILAVTVQNGTLPDIDACCEKRMGICQDLSATAVCMLRTQGIPAKLVIGYADASYHAWVVAYIDGEEIQYDPTLELNAMKKPTAYTTERYY